MGIKKDGEHRTLRPFIISPNVYRGQILQVSGIFSAYFFTIQSSLFTKTKSSRSRQETGAWFLV